MADTPKKMCLYMRRKPDMENAGEKPMTGRQPDE